MTVESGNKSVKLGVVVWLNFVFTST